MFSEAAACVGLAILLHLLLPKWLVAKAASIRCGICLSCWIAIVSGACLQQPLWHVIQVTGVTALVAVFVLTWAPWVWSTTEAPTLPEQP